MQTSKFIKAIYSIVAHLKTLCDLDLAIDNDEASSLQIYVSFNPSFAKNHTKTSQPDFFLFLVENSSFCHHFICTSYKLKLSARSVLGNEVLAIFDSFDTSMTMIQEQKNI